MKLSDSETLMAVRRLMPSGEGTSTNQSCCDCGLNLSRDLPWSVTEPRQFCPFSGDWFSDVLLAARRNSQPVRSNRIPFASR